MQLLHAFFAPVLQVVKDRKHSVVYRSPLHIMTWKFMFHSSAQLLQAPSPSLSSFYCSTSSLLCLTVVAYFGSFGHSSLQLYHCCTRNEHCILLEMERLVWFLTSYHSTVVWLYRYLAFCSNAQQRLLLGISSAAPRPGRRSATRCMCERRALVGASFAKASDRGLSPCRSIANVAWHTNAQNDFDDYWKKHKCVVFILQERIWAVTSKACPVIKT